MRFSPLNRVAARVLDGFPHLWHTVQLLRHRNSRVLHKFVTPEHDAVLEGFPRSGNSFAVRYFRQANRHFPYLAIGTHAHCIAQLRLALKYRLPTVVFIRTPDETVASLAALWIMTRRTRAQDSQAVVGQLLRDYKRYYSFLEEHRDGLVISGFATTTQDPARMIAAMNEKFGCSFAVSSGETTEVSAILANSRAHLSPSEERSAIKRQVAESFESPVNRRLLGEAKDIFDRVAKAAI